MLPLNTLSTLPVITGYPDPVKQPQDFLIDWERAGVALQDSSQGLLVQVWKLEVERDSVVADLWHFAVSAPLVAKTVLFSYEDVTEASLSFDQNMNPFVAFVAGGKPHMYWYDSTIPGQTITELATGTRSPRCTIDDKRAFNVGNSDNVLGYVRGGWLRVRYQRDRYQVEHDLCEVGPIAQLVSMATNTALRVQFRVRDVTVPTDTRYQIEADPYLSDVVLDLYERSGIMREHLEVNDLYGLSVGGFKVATEGGADSMVQALQSAFFFDPVEHDKKLRAKLRGGDVVANLTVDDLVERDESALEIERVQEAELLRLVNVTTLDSSIDYTTNKQTAERRSGTIQAKAESSIEIPLTTTPQFAAAIAMKRLKVAWGELQTYRFDLGISHSALTPGDVVTVLDRRGRTHRMRIMGVQEDGGTLSVEATEDAPWAYDVTSVGTVGTITTPPPSTTPGLIGDTVVAVVNIPVQKDQDDELGYYVGAVGTANGWYGAELQMSTDGGATVGQRLQISAPATIGSTLTALLPEASAEYLGQQTLSVSVPDPVESLSYDALLRYGNRAAIKHLDGTWEVLQFQTAVQIDDTTFNLSGLVRGRYATEPALVPAGAQFVLLDDSLVFVQIQQWMLSQPIMYRGVSYGQDSDEVEWLTLPTGAMASQTEWPVHYVKTVRGIDNSVTVSWIGRARLGVETAPRHSKYFMGYRVSYSDGVTADTTGTTHARTSVPAGVTVQVAALNSITGPGPASEAIPT